jgi:hypothetical protein
LLSYFLTLFFSLSLSRSPLSLFFSFSPHKTSTRVEACRNAGARRERRTTGLEVKEPR